MPHIRLRLLPLTLLFWGVISSGSAFASFSPPSNIILRVYRLESSGALWVNPATGAYHLCSSNDTYYGCTAIPNYAYPYSTNPVTIPIETDYLLDVVPKEVSVEAFHPTAIQAQAIAARSYAYWHIRQGSTINNSTQFQVFVPYAFEALNPTTFPDNPSNPCASSNLNTNQRLVCGAVAPRHYIAYGTYPNDDLPAFTEYFADIRNRTISGGQPYLIAVDDPISSHLDIV
ncbi:SpoIID/LytB domain-containing protein, partial [Thermogutta sp.]|uniref:SpoIID/LytB domain-containing protein n=1 Tax=Thermogutta sp. TaxID=1962930 RepID=UPI00322038A1